MQEKIRWRKTIFGGKRKKKKVTSAGVTERNKVRGENELNLRREGEDLEERVKYEERKR